MMMQRTARLVAVGLTILLAATAASGNDEGRSKSAVAPGEYLRFSYRTETQGGLAETMTTEVIPLSDGKYRVVTTTEQVTGLDEIRLGFFGGSFRWLGLYQSEDAAGRFDLSSLEALADQVLDPHKKYLLPDGGVLQTGDRSAVAGLPGIEGVFTQADAIGLTITVVLADDPYLRQLLPFPLSVRVDYDPSGTESEDDGAPVTVTFFSGTIELVEFTRTPTDEGKP